MGSLIYALIVGAAAGFLAGKFSKGSGFGLIGNLIVGIIGGFVGGLLARVLGLSAHSILAEILIATIGAIVFLWLLSFVRR
jgi:uncharacterized membrane protein YeaQ/YmgE (transglycosylase-associated protein family)